MREFLVSSWRGGDGFGLKYALGKLAIYLGLIAAAGLGYVAVSLALEESAVRHGLSLVAGLALLFGLLRFLDWRLNRDIWERRKLKQAQDLIARARGEKPL